MARLGMDSFDVPPPKIHEPKQPDESFFGNFQPMPADPSKKPSIDKLIDINHYLMRRVEELEEHIKLRMESDLRDQTARMREEQ